MKLNIPLRSAPDGQVNSERLVNMYAEVAGGKADQQLLSSPGLETVLSLSGGAIRGLYVHNGWLYALAGNSLYRVSDTYEATLVGVIPGSGLAIGASSGLELCITNSNNEGYIVDSVVTPIADVDFLGANSVDYLDGYFIFSSGENEFSISALYAGGSIDALDFATAESNPDKIVRAFIDHRELLLMGESTVETWVNTGNADFPFERVPGGVAEKGLASRHAVAKMDNSVYWLDSDGVVRVMQGGYSPQRVSTHEVERSLTNISSAEAFSFVWGGHEFFVLTSGSTWLYDASTQQWHERQSYNKSRWRANTHAFIYGNHYVGDFESGVIYKLSDSVFAEGSDVLVSEIVFPLIHNEQKRFRMHSVLLDMEVGEGPVYSTPKIRLDLSADGSTWNTVGYGSLGRTGERNHRVVWRRLGQHRNLHMRFIVSDPCKRAVYSAYAEITPDG